MRDDPDLTPVRDWYAATLARVADMTPGAVVYSWRACFRPVHAVDALGVWHPLPEPETGPLPPYDGPRPDLFAAGYSEAVPGPGGMVVRTAGGTLRDREQAGKAGLFTAGWASELRDALMASGRRKGARKGSAPEDVARALAWESLRLRTGPREATRTLLVWDDELVSPFADRTAADLVRAWRAGRKLNAIKRDDLQKAQSSVIRSCTRVLDKLDIEDARRIG
jgi:hypothetical protein